MTASQKPKTPSMNLELVPGVRPEDVDIFCKGASRLTMSQVVDGVTVTEAFVVDGEARQTRYTVNIIFFPREEYETEYNVKPPEILAAFATKFPLALTREIRWELKNLDADLKSQIADLGKGKTTKARRGDGDGDGDDGEGESQSATKETAEGDISDTGDWDAEDWKQAKRKRQQASYESDDEDESDDADEDASEGEDAVQDDFEDKAAGKPFGRKGNLQKKAKLVERHFIGNMPQATSFKFTEAACTFEIKVRQLTMTDKNDEIIFFSSSEMTCPSCCSSVL
jgi:hypothetical protein